MQFIKATELLRDAVSYLEGKTEDGQPHERNIPRAEAIINEILNFNIGNSIILYTLGSLHANKGNYGLAIQLLSTVTNMSPTMGEAWNNLGLAWKDVPDFAKAEYALKKAAKYIHESARADIYCNLAAINVTRNKPEAILEWANKALELEPTHQKAMWHKGLALLEMRQWSEAWDLHECRLTGGAVDKIAVRNYHGPDGMTPVWDGKTAGKLVIHGEQGMGDEVMFASCIPDAIATGCDIIFEPSPRMEKVFKRSFPGIKVYGTDEMHGQRWIEKEGKPDFKVALGSLPKFFRRTPESFPGTPYLKPDAGKRAWWGDKIRANGNKPVIGIAWQGGVQSTRYDARSFHPSMYKPLFEAIDATWVSLQYDVTAKGCVEDLKKDGIKVHHWPKAVEQTDPDTGKPSDLDELFALVSKCDLVVTVCQTAVHVAGSLGVPCFCLTPSEPSWRYSAGDYSDMPWYKSVRQFRQLPGSKDWSLPIAAVADELRTLQRKTA